MSNDKLISPLHRSKIAIEIWLARLPEAMKIDAQMALDSLMATAMREIDQAYRDGVAHRLAETTARRIADDMGK